MIVRVYNINSVRRTHGKRKGQKTIYKRSRKNLKD